ncbi:uroporphyrinogen decarboxylase [Gloeophyllum trabeum ATCC 11539]|uniref:Uroporphyrinogen decarboxylase n=1 Tax=Gloeophyllum trabeum (strain ATCC 11539 / FP-39264 / Madison 617) TaxID=670483 RepID=S7S1H8_GLOTA|nr:uroporphyrinogen decarboxylase [Gloeophyllum trabeum ATCC 11539]EPQ59614.1 uroporphyrinogen decarboxylase [Gloeophyllum trabeum ATCC 11539]
MPEAFAPLKNDLLIRAAKGEETARAPVWVMRQAGRYLPEFRAVRANHEFFEICRTPELASEITLQPIRRYKGLLDAAIIFSDILVVPQAMGMDVQMTPGPYFPEPLNVPADVEKLKKVVDVNVELGYMFEAITKVRKELNGEVPLIGFCGAPWTLFSYMIEGGGTKTFQKCKTWLFKYPEESKALLTRIADVCVDLLVGQIKAGAQLVQVFDSWAGELSPHDFAIFSLPSLKRISAGVRSRLASENIPAVPMTLFAKGANQSLAAQAVAGYDVLGLDWCIDAVEARRIVGDKVALQGNLDPNVLYGGREAIEREVKRMAESFKMGGSAKGWIANLGHGITPGVDPEDLRFFFECVHKYSAKAV